MTDAAPAEPALNRVIRLASQPGEVRAVIEDDFHHFRVVMAHDGQSVTKVSADSPRHPYSLCPAAGLQLRALIGTGLTTDVTALTRSVDARLQCTHQFDLAILAIASAARGDGLRRYDAVVPDRVAEVSQPYLLRDGVRVLDWTIVDSVITHPKSFAGVGLRHGFIEWVGRSLDHQAAEDAIVLRRAVFVSGGRGLSEQLDAKSTAPPKAGCWVQQPQRNFDARRMVGSTQDFTGRVADLTASDDDFLAGAEWIQDNIS